MFDERPDIQARLGGELIAWMTTVDAAGQPQTSPVWFLADDDVIVVYSLDRTPRTRNIRANAKVCLNLNSTPSGGAVVIIEGTAEIVPDGPPANEDERYVAKYEVPMADLGMTPGSFAADYPVRIRIRATRLRAS
jgi:PPOX class probable F420-dependent enzyme